MVAFQFGQEGPQLRMPSRQDREDADVLGGVMAGHRRAESQAVHAQLRLCPAALAQILEHLAQPQVNIDQLIVVSAKANVLVHGCPMVPRLHARGGL